VMKVLGDTFLICYGIECIRLNIFSAY
jgi:hypothetical protein